MQKDSFEFVRYEIGKGRDLVEFLYRCGDRVYRETVTLPQPIPPGVNESVLDVFLFNLHLALGISYWKARMLPIEVQSGKISAEAADYWNTVYTDGLGEFYYRNNLPIPERPLFTPALGEGVWSVRRIGTPKRRSLVGIGGGKDSLVTWKRMEKGGKDNSGLIVSTGPHKSRIEDIARSCNIPYLGVRRIMDASFLTDQLEQNWYRGHVPVSMIYAWLGLLCCFLYDYDGFVVSNEKSADAGNVEYQGRTINHQWSKSSAYERLMGRYLASLFDPVISYYSPLRNLSELEIVSEVVQYDNCLNSVTSCNRNFVQTSAGTPRWCGGCAKCAFNALMYASVLPLARLVELFEKNLFEDTALIPLFETVLGRRGIKPFDCVGTFEEAQSALTRLSAKPDYSTLPVVVALTTK